MGICDQAGEVGMSDREVCEIEMKWEEIEKEDPDTSFYTNRIKTDIECPKCKKKIFKRTDIILTSYPAQYKYECECGWVGYAYV